MLFLNLDLMIKISNLFYLDFLLTNKKIIQMYEKGMKKLGKDLNLIDFIKT